MRSCRHLPLEITDPDQHLRVRIRVQSNGEGLGRNMEREIVVDSPLQERVLRQQNPPPHPARSRNSAKRTQLVRAGQGLRAISI